MYFLFAVIFCLTLGLINGDHLSIDDKGVLMNDARRLLYVVGTYPEWQEKMANFQKKWGKKGEKYLNDPNVYIHGDVLSSDEVSEQKRQKAEAEEQVQRRYSNIDQMYKGLLIGNNESEDQTENESVNKKQIRHKLENMVKQSEHHNDILKGQTTPTRRFSNVPAINSTIAKPKKTRRKLDSNKPKNSIKKKNNNNTRRKALENEEQLERKYPSNIKNIYKGIWLKNNEDSKENIDNKNEEPKNTLENEDELERKYPNNIHKMYKGLVIRNNADPKDVKKLEMIKDPIKETENPTRRFSNVITINPTNSKENSNINEIKQKFINTRMKALENEGLTKEQLKRRYENIHKMYRGLLLNDSKTAENVDLAEDNIERKYSNIAHMYRGLVNRRNEDPNEPKTESQENKGTTTNVDNDDELLQRRFSNTDRMYHQTEDTAVPKNLENVDQLRKRYRNIDRMYNSILMRRNEDSNDPSIVENENEPKTRFNNIEEGQVQRRNFNDDELEKDDIENQYENNMDDLYNDLNETPENTNQENPYSRTLRPIRTKVYRFIHKIPDIHESETPKSAHDIPNNRYIPQFMVKDLTMSDKSLEKLSHPADMPYNNPSNNIMNTKEYISKDYKQKDYNTRGHKTKDYNLNDSNDSYSKEYKPKDYNNNNSNSWYSKYFRTRDDELRYLKEVVIPKILAPRAQDEKPKAAEKKLQFLDSSESRE